MRFPGWEYRLFIQNPSARHDRVPHAAAGMFRYLYTESHPRHLVESDLLYVRTQLSTVEYEFVIADGDRATVHTPGETYEAPIWELAKDDSLDLLNAAESNRRVFIRNRVDHRKLTHPDRRLQIQLRELLEIIESHPDVEFIVFAFVQPQLHFCFGMAGGAIKIRTSTNEFDEPGQVDRMRDVTTRFIRRYEVKYTDWSESPFVSRSDLAHDHAYVAMCLLKHIAPFIKDHFSNVRRIATPQDNLRAIFRSMQYTPHREFFSWPTGSGVKVGAAWSTFGDRIVCDQCSLRYACRIYEEGSVCALPGSNEQKLSSYFGTRDHRDVIEGIGRLVQYQADRVEESISIEDKRRRAIIEQYGPNNPEHPATLDPEVDKRINDLQKNAKQYAVLLNPALMSPKVAVQINNGGPAPVQLTRADVTPRMQAQAARELEAAGTPRERLTPEKIFEHILGQQKEIVEGEVVDGVRKDY